MTTSGNAVVILAAGAGTRIGRVGESLHKALVPINGRAVISHILDLMPTDARKIVVLGHRGAQIQEYLRLAHPKTAFTFVTVDWRAPGAGPGASLYAARDAVGHMSNLIFTSCDTLWERDLSLWDGKGSWAAVAHVPAGTDPTRWCRMVVNADGTVREIYDKVPTPGGDAYTGLARIARDDLETFWSGIGTDDTLRENEKQVTGGFRALTGMSTRRISWIDVGDDVAYRTAVMRLSGYDFTKVNEATYVLPDEGRVVKFWQDTTVLKKRYDRGIQLRDAVPRLTGVGESMMSYRYLPGKPVYETIGAETGDAMRRVLKWASDGVWRPVAVHVDAKDTRETCLRFYRDKTLKRIALLKNGLSHRALDAVAWIDWEELARNALPAVIHGDFNFGNIIDTDDGLRGIDWREDFGGATDWGDVRYDFAKLLGGTRVHWQRAQRGDFRPWDAGQSNEDVIRDWVGNDITFWRDINIIGGLTLLNSAPLHAAPLDDILVTRGSAWLESIAGNT